MLKNETLKKTLLIFLCIYPIFSLKIFYNNYATLIQIVFIAIFLLWTLFVNKNSRKSMKYLVVYIIILGLYGILHYVNALDFYSLVPGDFDFSNIDETLYLIKMSIPIFFMYLMYHSKFQKEDYLKIIKSWIIMICGIIIIANIFKISFSSYNDEIIKGSIFSWFNKNYIYNELASKGFFMYANQIACLLVTIIPICLYYYLEKRLKFVYLILLLLTTLMLGTRVSNLGSILVFIALILSYITYNILKKDKINWKKLIPCGILIVFYITMLPFSPTFSRYEVYDYLLPKSINSLIASTENSYISDIEYIKNNYEEKLINENFILNSYPYEYDPEFWLTILNEPINKRADYRYLEIAMVSRVKEINNNNMDTLFGITNDRIQNIFNIERDYILQYYAYGIIGCILFLGIYLVLLIKSFKNLIFNFNYFNICVCSSIILFLFISYLSGNILNQISIFIPLLIIAAMAYIKVEKQKKL